MSSRSSDPLKGDPRSDSEGAPGELYWSGAGPAHVGTLILTSTDRSPPRWRMVTVGGWRICRSWVRDKGRGVEASGYRGPERRRGVDTDAGGQAWMLAAATLVVVLFVVLWVVHDGRALVAETAARSSMHTAEAVLAVVLMTTALAHWRAVGRRHGLLVAIAGLVLGVVAVIDLVDVASSAVQFPVGPRSALGLTAALWVGRAIWGPEVDTSIRAHREALALGVAVLGTAAVVVTTVSIGPFTLGFWCLVVAVAWFAAAFVGIVRAVDRGWVLLGWVSWAAVALGLAELARWQASIQDAGWAFVSGAMGGTGLLVGAVGGIWALAGVALRHRSDLYGLLLDDQVREQADQGERRELAHEIRNALLAVEGATATMERLGDRLTDDQRRQLQRVVQSGMANLRALVDAPSTRHVSERFRLDEVVEERAAAAEARGVRVLLEIDGPLEVRGDVASTGRALDNLLLNAERHGQAGHVEPITLAVGAHVDVDQDTAWGIVQVMDRGPGVPTEARDAVFREGHQLHPERGGEGIGLHAARDLLRRQDGDLRYEDRPGGGACFVLALPLSVRHLEGAHSKAPDEVDDGV